MADKTFNKTSGAQDWATGGNWTPSGVPATGDRVYIRAGDSTLVITAGSTQAAVTLAELNIYDIFAGQLTVDVKATLERIGLPSGQGAQAGGATRIVRNNGSAAANVIVYKTGNSADAASGLGAYQWTGTATTNVITVLAGSVDIATDLSTAAVATLNVQGGTVVVGPNATTTAVVVTAGALTHNGLCAAGGTALLTNGTLTTSGATLFPTVTVIGGRANLNHRAASGASATDVFVYGGSVSVQGDPRAFNVTNGVRLYPDATLAYFSLAQFTGGGLVVTTPGSLTAAVGSGT